MVYYNQNRMSIDTVKRQSIVTSPIKFECQAVNEKKVEDSLLDESRVGGMEISQDINGSTFEVPIATMAQL